MPSATVSIEGAPIGADVEQVCGISLLFKWALCEDDVRESRYIIENISNL